MKLLELFEDVYQSEKVDQVALDIANTIKRDCKSYLQEKPKGRQIFRAFYHQKHLGPLTKFNYPTDRKAIDTNPIVHELVDKAMDNLGIIARRKNSIFAWPADYLGNRRNGGSVFFGENMYVVFPIGEFSFAYSPKVTDLYDLTLELETIISKSVGSSDIEQVNSLLGATGKDQVHSLAGFDELTNRALPAVEEYIRKLGYKDDINGAMSRHFAEVMVTGDSYYLLKAESKHEVSWRVSDQYGSIPTINPAFRDLI
jgi:hypothetical protein